MKARIVLALSVGLPLTLIVMAFSFWLAHMHPLVLFLIAPSLIVTGAMSLEDGLISWIVIAALQFAYYYFLAGLYGAHTRRKIDQGKSQASANAESDYQEKQ